MKIDNNKLFRTAGIISNILCVLFSIGLFIQLVCMLWLCLMPDKLADFFESFRIWQPFITDMYPYSQAKAELSSSMLTYAFAVFFTRNASLTFKSLKNGVGVDKSILKKVSVIAIICSCTIPLVHNLAFASFVCSGFTRSGIDISMLLFGLALLTFSLYYTKNKN
ncbi:MAG: hypothetical protein IKV53_06910 [Clostridia bacterium]|nr:hypothetical protein [Clostridia bacterium]